mmetsp:Transcript_67260/g.112615  ORF Transcript_67260/g.112615 Transcript_67260/m.112615 type:complete len:260 (+) Transcript_67260:4733-5512(+)
MALRTDFNAFRLGSAVVRKDCSRLCSPLGPFDTFTRAFGDRCSIARPRDPCPRASSPGRRYVSCRGSTGVGIRNCRSLADGTATAPTAFSICNPPRPMDTAKANNLPNAMYPDASCCGAATGVVPLPCPSDCCWACCNTTSAGTSVASAAAALNNSSRTESAAEMHGSCPCGTQLASTGSVTDSDPASTSFCIPRHACGGQWGTACRRNPTCCNGGRGTRLAGLDDPALANAFRPSHGCAVHKSTDSRRRSRCGRYFWT